MVERLQNVYLDGLDHFAKRALKMPAYLRYMDDVAIFGPTRGAVRGWAEACAVWLEKERALEVHPGYERPVRTSEAHRFLGYVVERAGCRVAGRTVRRLVARTMAAVRERSSDAALAEVEQALLAGTRSLCL